MASTRNTKLLICNDFGKYLFNRFVDNKKNKKNFFNYIRVMRMISGDLIELLN